MDRATGFEPVGRGFDSLRARHLGLSFLCQVRCSSSPYPVAIPKAAMSVFTNSSRDAGTNAAAYVAAVLDLLGDRDPMTVLRDTPEALPRVIQGLAVRECRQPEHPGKWSIVQVLQHLA